MSLDADKLYRDFARWFKTTGGVTTSGQAETKLARVYHAYAQGAEDVSGEHPINLSADKFEQPLRFRSSRSARQFARQLDNAFVAYWTGVVFPIFVPPPAFPPCPNVGGSGEFSSEIVSLVTAVTPNAMYRAVLPILNTARATADSAARKLANAMDQVTRSAVTVLIVGWDTTAPPTGPFLITNTCTVF